MRNNFFAKSRLLILELIKSVEGYEEINLARKARTKIRQKIHFVKGCRFAVSFRGISQLGSAIFLRWFKPTHMGLNPLANNGKLRVELYI